MMTDAVDSSVADRTVAAVVREYPALSILETLESSYYSAVSEALDARRLGNKVMADSWRAVAVELGVRRDLHKRVIA